MHWHLILLMIRGGKNHEKIVTGIALIKTMIWAGAFTLQPELNITGVFSSRNVIAICVCIVLSLAIACITLYSAIRLITDAYIKTHTNSNKDELKKGFAIIRNVFKKSKK